VEGDVLVLRDRRSTETVAKYVDSGSQGIAIPTPAVRLRLGDLVDPVYLAHLMNSARFRRKNGILSCRAPVSPPLSKDALNELKIPVFPMANQKAFASFARKADRCKGALLTEAASILTD
jgi:hypothetical protein